MVFLIRVNGDRRSRFHATLFALFMALTCGLRAETPRSLDPRIEIVPFAESPQIVHPIGLDFDRQGRLLVIESHTHFRPAGYQGPPHDRVRRVEDTDGDGRADRFTTFFEGTQFTMDIAVHLDGSVYLATRNEILRLRDLDNDGAADEKTRIVFLDTPGNYPHNGLSGLTFDRDGNLYFGMGENLGAAYQLRGADNSTVVDEGEGGNVFWCTADGKHLRRVATGFWNPFGLHFDHLERLWCVDNDPDASPPCRLLHVVEGGDYGYQFRYGRSGRHVFQSWNGQLPGTLPMVSGTGEAPCEVIEYRGNGLPDEYRGELLVTSWADHRVERYTLRPRGASYTADRKPFIQGGTEFRPVGLAVAPDGSLFISDWVRRDYNLHGQGALWHIRPRAAIKNVTKATPDEVRTSGEIHAAAQRLASIEGLYRSPTPRQLLDLLDDDDPFIRSAAVRELSRSNHLTGLIATAATRSNRQRMGLLLAERTLRPGDSAAAQRWLEDSNEEVRLLAVKWVADQRMSGMRPQMAAALERDDLNVRMYQAYATALNRIDGLEVSDAKLADHFVKILADDNSPPARRVAALRLVPPTHKQLSFELLQRLIASTDSSLQFEAVRTLAEHADPRRFELFARLARDAARDLPLRAEAIVGLSAQSPPPIELFVEFAVGDNLTLSDEALRALAGTTLTPEQKSRLGQCQSADKRRAALLARALGEPMMLDRPPLTQTAAWLDQLSGPADAAAGRRTFFHARLANCARCHRAEGHGQDVGPDLGIIGRTERRHLLESILQPSTLVAPHYQVWQLTTDDGRTLTGMLLRTQLDEYTYVDPQGVPFKIRTVDVVESIPAPLSIMPNNLIDKLTDQELRDLLAYLGSLK